MEAGPGMGTGRPTVGVPAPYRRIMYIVPTCAVIRRAWMGGKKDLDVFITRTYL